MRAAALLIILIAASNAAPDIKRCSACEAVAVRLLRIYCGCVLKCSTSGPLAHGNTDHFELNFAICFNTSSLSLVHLFVFHNVALPCIDTCPNPAG